MEFRKGIIFICLFILLFTIAGVTADDMDDAAVANADETALASENRSYEVISAEEQEPDEILSSKSHDINMDNYGMYFDKDGKLISSKVNYGDTINLEGTFNDKNFNFNKPVNVVGGNQNCLNDCMLTFAGKASGSTVSNLNIFNTKNSTIGIFLNGVSNCIITGCFINNTGRLSYAVCLANDANHNNVTGNALNTYGVNYGESTRSTSPVLVSGSHYNYIADNIIGCGDANAIYLSSYPGGPLNGGKSNFNLIFNNTIRYNVLPTSWSYGIQLMGGNNTVDSNRIIGAYRGVSSSSDSGNIIINNWIINLTGHVYNQNPAIEEGGDYGIAAGPYSTIINNTILNARLIDSGSGISVVDNSIVENNRVQVTNNGIGINPAGSNVEIRNNNITTISGEGILYKSHSCNLSVTGNIIVSQSGFGVSIQKVSERKKPWNITIINNSICVDSFDHAITIGFPYDEYNITIDSNNITIFESSKNTSANASNEKKNIVYGEKAAATEKTSAAGSDNAVKLTLKKVKVKKSAKKLVLKATLKKGGKALSGKKITFKFNGKKYTAKTNKKGVAKVTIKKSVLKKLKVGKKVTYRASYGKITVKKTVKVKK